jgi:small GTP-binding protein
MGEKPQKIQEQKQISLGVLAHVDAGKTTLSEGLLFKCGRIRKIGRVDHKDAYLDTYELERERGITIFSKQAVFSMGAFNVTLLDTPGHVDFSAEMERTLQVLDYAILVINGADGVQGHTQTLWRLLEQYKIPTFLFVNKMDQDGTDREGLLQELKKKLSGNCVDFGGELECHGVLHLKYSFVIFLYCCDFCIIFVFLYAAIPMGSLFAGFLFDGADFSML